MILLIDNYDSFTYNLYQYIGIFDHDIKVVRNDKITIDEIEKLNPDRIVLSPGPKNPSEAGICMDVVKKFTGVKPILGICLGHQCIGEADRSQRVIPKIRSHYPRIHQIVQLLHHIPKHQRHCKGPDSSCNITCCQVMLFYQFTATFLHFTNFPLCFSKKNKNSVMKNDFFCKYNATLQPLFHS